MQFIYLFPTDIWKKLFSDEILMSMNQSKFKKMEEQRQEERWLIGWWRHWSWKLGRLEKKRKDEDRGQILKIYINIWLGCVLSIYPKMPFIYSIYIIYDMYCIFLKSYGLPIKCRDFPFPMFKCFLRFLFQTNWKVKWWKILSTLSIRLSRYSFCYWLGGFIKQIRHFP